MGIKNLIELKQEHRIPTQNVPLGLPKSITSMCPECGKLIDATILEKDGRVVMEKTCKQDGFFDDLISPNVDLYLKMEKWAFADGTGIKNPIVQSNNNCPFDCGICTQHKSYACMVNIDLTNRCSLNCPICFANAHSQGYVYELSLEQVKEMLRVIKKAFEPCVLPAVQFSGGEPSIHPNFIEAIKLAYEVGFKHIQVATNGIKFLDLDFAKKCKEAGLHTLYLQFDGLDDDRYKKTRGTSLLKTKLKVVDNCRKVGLRICLVPTIVKTINDDQVGKILQFAIDNVDVISSISYQPVSFTGRISLKQRKKQRYTSYDLASDLEKQTGYFKIMEDFYPMSVVSPLSKVISKLKGKKQFDVTCHSNCGFGTYLFVNKKTRQAIPLTQIVDIEGFMTDMWKIYKENNIVDLKFWTGLKVLHCLKKHYKKNELISFSELMKMVGSYIGRKSKESDWDVLMILSMHFQDRYDYNVDRTKRCTIHYAAPNGRLYPFCSYNSGPVFRNYIEKKYSVPINKWQKEHGKEYITNGFYKE